MITRVQFGMPKFKVEATAPVATMAARTAEREPAANVVPFGRQESSDRYTLTVDLPETLQRQLQSLKDRRGQTHGQVISNGIAILQARHKIEDNCGFNTTISIIKPDPRRDEFKGSRIRFLEVHPFARSYQGEPTRPVKLQAGPAALDSLDHLAEETGRTREQLIRDAIALQFETIELRRRHPEYQPGFVLLKSDGGIRDIYWLNN